MTSAKMLSVQRRDAIKAMLLEKESITINEVIEKFGISVETARRDFDVLANEGFLNKVYGGATLKTRTSAEPSRELIRNAFSEGKNRIAQRAVRFLKPGDTIYMDGSDTVAHMYRGMMNEDVTVMTNSWQVIDAFRKSRSIQIMSTGGRYSRDAECFLGPTCIDFISQFRFDRAFISCKSISKDGTLGVADEQVAAVLRTVIDHSEQVYLLADHSKFGKASFIRLCSLSEMNCIFTDTSMTEEWQKITRKANVPVFQCTETGFIDPPESID